jgi:hypothetical protein
MVAMTEQKRRFHMALEIEKVLTISTAHLSPETAKVLTEENSFGWIVFPKGDIGWFIYTAKQIDVLDPPDTPTDLLQCVLLARANDCAWLCLDRDAGRVMGAPTYEW